MDELENEKSKIKKSAKKVRKKPVKNIKKEIEENYEIGIEYYKDIRKADSPHVHDASHRHKLK